MRTAVLVLAILGDVFGGIGAVLAMAFSATLVGSSGGIVGKGAAGGAVLALLALIIGIVGTALATRRPRVAGTLLVIAAILSLVGTYSFALGSLLYVIGGVMAFFVEPLALSTTSPVGATAGVSVGALTTADAPTVVVRRFRPLATRRIPLVAGAVLVVLFGAVAVSALVQPAEQKPVNALLSGLQRGDDVALADLLLPGLRANDAVADANAVLSNALGRSQISFISTDWLRRWGPVTGTKIGFENLTITTASKGANSAVVHVRAIFAPTNENPLINAIVQVLRQPFDADVPIASEGGQWYVSGESARRPPTPPPPSTSPSTPPTNGGSLPPSAPPPSTPPPSLPTVTMARATFTADFNTASDLMTAGRVGFGRFQLTYAAGRALLSECAGGISDNRCLWGLDHPGWVAVAATGTSDNDWGVFLRADPANWRDRQGLGSAVIASIFPPRGEYLIRIVGGNGTSDVVVATGPCTCINRTAANTVEFAVVGAELQLSVNGVVARTVADTQGVRGNGYGVFVTGQSAPLGALTLTYFAAR